MGCPEALQGEERRGEGRRKGTMPFDICQPGSHSEVKASLGGAGGQYLGTGSGSVGMLGAPRNWFKECLWHLPLWYPPSHKTPGSVGTVGAPEPSAFLTCHSTACRVTIPAQNSLQKHCFVHEPLSDRERGRALGGAFHKAIRASTVIKLVQRRGNADENHP
jgi:hypothetical protein